MNVALYIRMLILSTAVSLSANAATNTVLNFGSDKRSGLHIFVEECLPRGLTNSITVEAFQAWATTNIEAHRQLEARGLDPKLDDRPEESEIPQAVAHLQDKIPSCAFTVGFGLIPMQIDPDLSAPRIKFIRTKLGEIEAISIAWYLYGIDVGPPSYKWDFGPPFFVHEIEKGVFVYHGMK